MSYKSMKNWDREQREPLLSKVTDRIHHQEPLKEKISQCVYKLKVQQNRLEGANLKTQQHDKSLFDKCVQAQMAKDTMRSAMYANEIAEIRKIAKVTLRSELALEQVVLRLETIQEFGEATGQGYDLEASGPEASKIISEANTIAETRMREKFPELPSPTATAEHETVIPR